MSVISYPLTGEYGKDKHVLIDEETFNKISGRRLCCLKTGYVMLWNKEINKPEYFHRWLMGLEKGDKRVVDHIDRNYLNCCMSNLRLVSIEENMQNRSKTTTKTTSKFKGVWKNAKEKKWRAVIKKNGIVYQLGSFQTEEEAAEAYNKKAVELNHGYALLNIIN